MRWFDDPVSIHIYESRELEKLQGDIQRALSSNKLERFINSTEDASSLTSHDNTIRAIVDTLIVRLFPPHQAFYNDNTFSLLWAYGQAGK